MSIKKEKNLLWQTDFISLFCNSRSSCTSFCFLVFQKYRAPKAKKRLSAIRLGVTVEGISWNPGITFSLHNQCLHCIPQGLFKLPFQRAQQCWVCWGAAATCVTNLLEAFSECTTFCLCFPIPPQVLWIRTAPAQPLLLPRITSQSVMWRHLKWLSHLKSRVLLSYSSSLSLWACQWEFEQDRSCAVNDLGQH